MNDVMVDLETLALTADTVIMSIGAVRFDAMSDKMDDDGFYASVSIESNLALGRRVDESTLVWWLKQTPAAQRVFAEDKVPLSEALESFSTWVGDENRIVWSNGANFDIPILEHAYRQLDWLAPWKFYNARCYRTVANMPAVKAAKLSKPTVQHNALADAVDQAKMLQAMFAVINGMKKAR